MKQELKNLFRKYSSIENTYRTKYLMLVRDSINMGYCKDDFVVEEKVHGCLTYDALVETKEYGTIKIGKLIEEKLECHIKSYNIEMDRIEYSNVTEFSILDESTDWYEIETESGEKLILTGNHPVFMSKNIAYRKTENLKEGDEILID